MVAVGAEGAAENPGTREMAEIGTTSRI